MWVMTVESIISAWWRHQMETFSALLAIFARNSPVPVKSPHKGQWHGALMLSLICARINGWVNNREAGDLRRHQAHCDVIEMDSMSIDLRLNWICISLRYGIIRNMITTPGVSVSYIYKTLPRSRLYRQVTPTPPVASLCISAGYKASAWLFDSWFALNELSCVLGE